MVLRCRRLYRRPAFTLVELLVVMGIIGVLVALLLPAVNKAVSAVRRAATAHKIANVGAALENFKKDWGIYPPSDKSDADASSLSGFVTGQGYGYQLMAVALAGPESKGWGAATSNDVTPFGGTDASRTYGPYYQTEAGVVGDQILDAFPSPKLPILYFRYEPGGTPEYSASDNPVSSPREGFQSQNHFELSAKYMGPDNQDHWQRKDYLLISPGADRLYGYVQYNEQTGAVTAASGRTSASTTLVITCDDVTNF